MLPDAWIERVFQKFEDFYGAKWAALYGDFPRERVKRTWAEELSGFAAMPDCIGSAIKVQLASPHPPTLPEFLSACRAVANRGTAFNALPAPQIDKDEAKARLAELKRRMRMAA